MTPPTSSPPPAPQNNSTGNTITDIKNNKTNEAATLRDLTGNILAALSDTVNNNLIAARYATCVTVTLLAGYGLSQTPLFFRYKTVRNIPASAFLRRRTLRGRIVSVTREGGGGNGGSTTDGDGVCLLGVMLLPPVGRLLGRGGFEFFFMDGRRRHSEGILLMELAGIRIGHPRPNQYSNQPYTSNIDPAKDSEQWLQNLATRYTPVTVQLLARRHRHNDIPPTSSNNPIDALHPWDMLNNTEDNDKEEVAICRMWYQPKGHYSIFKNDLTLSLLENGRAITSSPDDDSDYSNTSLQWDASDNVKHMQNDTKYLEQCNQAEYNAFCEQRGVWNDEALRKEERGIDLLEEMQERNKGFGRRMWDYCIDKASSFMSR